MKVEAENTESMKKKKKIASVVGNCDDDFGDSLYRQRRQFRRHDNLSVKMLKLKMKWKQAEKTKKTKTKKTKTMKSKTMKSKTMKSKTMKSKKKTTTRG